MLTKIKKIINYLIHLPFNLFKGWCNYIFSYLQNVGKDREYIFTRIYKNKIWGATPDGSKYFSGSGSISPGIEKYKKLLLDFIRDNEVKSIFEIGCDDFTIMESVLDQSEVAYIGADVVKSLINHLSSTYGNDKTSFLHLDAAKNNGLPHADLCIIRQILQHLSNNDIAQIIKNTTMYKFVIVTEQVPISPKRKNKDKITDNFTRLNIKNVSEVFLDAPPFSLTCKTLLQYNAGDIDIPAVMLTSLIEKNI